MNIIQPFRQSTAATILVGPFVTVASGATPITNLDIANVGARLLRPGVAAINLSGRSWVHNYGGHYDLDLLIADFATLGPFRIVMSDSAVFCPIWLSGWVFDEATYDAFMTEGGLNSIRPILVVGPITAGIVPMNNRISSQIELAVFRREAKTHPLTLVDATGEPVDIPDNVKFVVETAVPEPVKAFVVEDADITRDDNVAQVPTTQDDNALDSEVAYQWRFWDTDTNSVLQHGPYRVIPTSEEDEA
jgi:hypothetical protein